VEVVSVILVAQDYRRIVLLCTFGHMPAGIVVMNGHAAGLDGLGLLPLLLRLALSRGSVGGIPLQILEL
jgi:hypothetical protein